MSPPPDATPPKPRNFPQNEQSTDAGAGEERECPSPKKRKYSLTVPELEELDETCIAVEKDGLDRYTGVAELLKKLRALMRGQHVSRSCYTMAIP